MTLKSGAKFEETLALSSKSGMKNLVNFHVSNGKPENFYIDVLLFQKYITFEPKKCRGVICHNTEQWRKTWEGTSLCFQKWHEVFGEQVVEIKGTVMQNEKALINDCLRVSKVSWKFRIPLNYTFGVIHPWKFTIFWKSCLLLNNFYCFFCL